MKRRGKRGKKRDNNSNNNINVIKQWSLKNHVVRYHLSSLYVPVIGQEEKKKGRGEGAERTTEMHGLHHMPPQLFPIFPAAHLSNVLDFIGVFSFSIFVIFFLFFSRRRNRYSP